MKRNSFLNIICIVALGLISFGVYANSLHGDYLIDDQPGIQDNAMIHDAGYFFSHFSLRPGIFMGVIYTLLWPISGGNPFAFHVFNVCIHTGCAIALFALCMVLFRYRALAFLSSLIFAVHPIHTEAVSWLSGGHYALSSLLFICAVICYIKSRQSIGYLLATVIFFGLGLFSGNAIASLPLLLLCYEVFFRQGREQPDRLRRPRIIVLAAVIIIGGLFVAGFFVSRNMFMHKIFYFRGFHYLIVAAKALVYYLKLLYLPLARGLYHPFSYTALDIQKVSPALFGSLAAMAIAAGAFFACRRRMPAVSFGIAWFFVTYAPFSNIIPVCNIISERYIYLPSVGFSILIAALFLKAWGVINRATTARKVLRAAALSALTVYLCSYAALTLKHNYEYNNMITYWEGNINNFPDGYSIYNNLAGTYYAMGQAENAIAYSWVNLMINPHQPHVWCNLGKVYAEQGDLAQAISCYEEALKVDKNYFPAVKAIENIKARPAYAKIHKP